MTKQSFTKGKSTILYMAVLVVLASCGRNADDNLTDAGNEKIIFLHHSTGQCIWNGGEKSANGLMERFGLKNSASYVQKLFQNYNEENARNYTIEQLTFPKDSPYGWNNYPYDYYNIWVKNGGSEPFMEEPTLEMLTGEYQVIIFKHCFPASNVLTGQETSDINSDYKSVANYKLQYQALKSKLHQFPDVKFILWTGAAQVKTQVTEEEAERAREFFIWVKENWDVADDNIYIWDFFELETEGGLYLLDTYAQSTTDSHPNAGFSKTAADLFFKRIVDVIENDGEKTMLTGETL